MVNSKSKGCSGTFQAIIQLTMTLLFGGAFPESYVLANDQEQARSRVFEICCRIINASPLLRDEATITEHKITFPACKANSGHHFQRRLSCWGNAVCRVRRTLGVHV